MKIGVKTMVWSLAIGLGLSAPMLSVSAGESPEANSTAEKSATPVAAEAPAAAAAATGATGKEEAAKPAATEPAHESTPVAQPVRVEAKPVSKGCLADNLAIDDIKKGREELELKNRDLTARESELKAREVALEEELKKIQDVRDQITLAEGIQKKANEEKVAKLVETFETMSPKAASQLLSNVDENLAVVAMARISTVKLAKIMNLMESTKASKLTELLAGVTRARKPLAGSTSTNRNDVAAVTNPKGGEKNDGNIQQNANSPATTGQREPASKNGNK